jgi:hypothetical protein
MEPERASKTRGPLTYIGGKEKNKHVSKRKKDNIGGKGKQSLP